MSIKKVADIAGVSIATVSRYFNNPNVVKKETLDKVENAIKEINYQPNTLAQNFRRGKSGIIVVVVHNIGDPLYRGLAQTIAKTAELKGYDILIKETNHNHLPLEYYRDMLSSKQVDGLIVMVDLPEMGPESQHALKDLPIILVKGETLEFPSEDIGFDNYDAAETATNHLILLGHRNIACITQSNESTAYIRRKAGFITAMNKAKLKHQNNIFFITENDGEIKNIINRLWKSRSRPTAIFCLDDDLAIDTIHYAKQLNLHIPKDLSIIGFNNIPYSANTSPPLTTIKQPVAEAAQYSIEVLCSKIEGAVSPERREKPHFKHQLIVRSSTTIPPY